MPVSLNFEVDASSLDNWDIIPAEAKERALRKAAGHYMLLQRERIAKGVDVHGQPFRPYSRSYKDRKDRAGRTGKNEFLRLSGKMLRSQRIDIVMQGNELVAVISFEGTRPASKIEDAGRKREMARTSRSKRGLVTSKHKRENRERQAWGRATRSQRGALKQPKRNRLVVTIDEGKMVANAVLAGHNNRIRKFIGISEAELEELTALFVKELKIGTAKG